MLARLRYALDGSARVSIPNLRSLVARGGQNETTRGIPTQTVD